jgi:hypothetical protein
MFLHLLARREQSLRRPLPDDLPVDRGLRAAHVSGSDGRLNFVRVSKEQYRGHLVEIYLVSLIVAPQNHRPSGE